MNRTDITGNTPVQNHRDHNTEEYNDDGRVDETEPMYPRVENVQVMIPACCLVDMVSGVVGETSSDNLTHGVSDS